MSCIVSSMPAPSSLLLAQLQAVCELHPVAPKRVFVAHQQLGRAIATALAPQVGACGVQCVTVAAYTRQLAHRQTALSASPNPHGTSSTEVLGATGRRLVVWDLLRDDVSAHGPLPASPDRLVSMFDDALQTLRQGGVPPGALRKQDSDTSASLARLDRMARRYAERLDAEGLRDAASLLHEANAPASSAAVSIVCGDVMLTQAEVSFLERVLGGPDYVLTPPHAAAAPSRSAIRVYAERADVRTVPVRGSVARGEPAASDATSTSAPASAAIPEGKGGSTSFCRAVGPQGEVKTVLRRILNRGTPFDQVEVAYTASDPYLPLLVDEAERAGLPVTTGTGLPMHTTRPGQLLIGICQWVEDGYPARQLVDLLRSGLLRTEPWMRAQRSAAEDDAGHWYAALSASPFLTSSKAATLLAESCYGSSRNSYRAVLTERIDRANRGTWTRSALMVLRRFLDALLDTLPVRGTLPDMARGLGRLVERFGPQVYAIASASNASSDAETQEGDTPKTYDQMADAVLKTRLLPRWQTLTFSETYAADGLARFVRQRLEAEYAGATQPKPGAVHILPLDSAGLIGRSDLYVVGLDSETASAPASDGPLLTEDIRDDLSSGPHARDMEATRVPLPQPLRSPNETAWQFRAALQRHHGHTTLVAMHLDPADGEKRFPSALYAEQLAQHQTDAKANGSPPRGEARATLVPNPEQGLFLTDAEAWLPESPRQQTQQSDREALADRFPWLLDGEAARQARTADDYTEFDGLLPKGTYAELDFLDPAYDGPPLSAGRLQTFAESPYGYFVQYVLGVKPLDEPALDDEPWLNPLRKGSILHDAFEAFMQRSTKVVGTYGLDVLMECIQEKVEDEAAVVHLGDDESKRQVLRQLETPARIFLAWERNRPTHHVPHRFEWGFGYSERRQQEGDADDLRLRLSDGTSLPVRGRVDRIDRAETDTGTVLHLWDYKTGGQSSFDATNPLNDGAKLQWALYAMIAAQHFGHPVARSGYIFLSEKEMGTDLVFPFTDTHRQATDRLIRDLAECVRTGCFPMTPTPDKAAQWKFERYADLIPDLEQRAEQLKRKTYPDDRATPPPLQDND